MHGLRYISTSLTPVGTEAALWLLLALPLVGALVCGGLAFLGGRRAVAAGRLASVVAVAAVAATFMAAVVLVVGQLLPLPEDQRVLRAWPGGLFTVSGVRVSFGLFLDPLAAVMVLLVSGLSALIHLYATAYMRDDPARPRFFAFLNLFVAAMLLLVLGDGFAPLYFGWEGVGACSYFLIGFWHRRARAGEAATKAFIVNRVGDAALVVGIGLLLWGMANVSPRPGEFGTLDVEPRPGAAQPSGGEAPIRRRPVARQIPVGATLSFAELRDQVGVEIFVRRAPVLSSPAAPEVHLYPARSLLARMTVAGMPVGFLACLLIFLGAAGKSAQLPFSAWLPDAMAGPTPVSALIHAATMVTAGVYLLARLGFLFALSHGAGTVVAVVGILTALWGAVGGLFQNDLKRVLAYSTVSQLGYMFAAAAGGGGGSAAIFHVVTHGFFKAGLFLSAGIIIHAVEARLARGGRGDHGGDDALGAAGGDLRNMGGLARALPWTRWAYLAACVALAGFPIASGFFSKDQIFGVLATATNLAVPAPLLLGALALTTFLTSWYAFRSYYLVFFGRDQAATGAAGAARAPVAAAPLSRLPAGPGEPRMMAGVALVLAAGAVVVGPWLGWPRNWSAEGGGVALERFLAPVFSGLAGATERPEVRPAVEWGLQVGGVILATLGLLVARGLHARGARPVPTSSSSSASRDRLRRFCADGLGLDAAYRRLAVQPVLGAARAAAWMDRRVFDRGVDGVAAAGVRVARFLGAFDRRVIDGAVDGISGGVVGAGRRAARLQNGRLSSYLLVIAAGVAGLVVLLYFLAT